MRNGHLKVERVGSVRIVEQPARIDTAVRESHMSNFTEPYQARYAYVSDVPISTPYLAYLPNGTDHVITPSMILGVMMVKGERIMSM